MLTDSTNVHGVKVMDSLRVETCNVEFSQSARNVTEFACGLVHRDLFTKDDRIGVVVSLDVAIRNPVCC